MGAKAPHKIRQKEAQAKKQTEWKRENRQQAQTYLQNTTIQCIIYAINNTKTSKNKADKINNADAIQLPSPDTRKRKNARTKTRTNSERTQPKPKQENTQRKQKH